MNYLRIVAVILSLCLIASSISYVYSVLVPVLSAQELYRVVLAFVILILSSRHILFALGWFFADQRSKKIQKEIDIERSFRNIGGDI